MWPKSIPRPHFRVDINIGFHYKGWTVSLVNKWLPWQNTKRYISTGWATACKRSTPCYGWTIDWTWGPFKASQYKLTPEGQAVQDQFERELDERAEVAHNLAA